MSKGRPAWSLALPTIPTKILKAYDRTLAMQQANLEAVGTTPLPRGGTDCFVAPQLHRAISQRSTFDSAHA